MEAHHPPTSLLWRQEVRDRFPLRPSFRTQNGNLSSPYVTVRVSFSICKYLVLVSERAREAYATGRHRVSCSCINVAPNPYCDASVETLTGLAGLKSASVRAVIRGVFKHSHSAWCKSVHSNTLLSFRRLCNKLVFDNKLGINNKVVYKSQQVLCIILVIWRCKVVDTLD